MSLEIYDSEEQQVEAIKQWWQENGKSILAGVVLGLVGLFGWRYYNEYRQASQEAAAATYEQVALQLANGQAKSFPALEAFVAEHKGEIYGDLAALQLAAAAVKEGKLDLAEAQLTTVAEQASREELKPIAGLRLARVLGEQGKYDAAAKVLDGISQEPYAAMVAEVRGDLFVRQGKLEQARAAYQQAQQKGGLQSSPELTLKLDDLAASAAPAEEKPDA